MLFNSFTFLLFFIFFFTLYFLLRRQLLAQNLLILISSYLFYGWWDERFLILIMLSTVTDFITGLAITKQKPTLPQALALTAFLLILGSILHWRTWDTTAWTILPLLLFVGLGWLLHSYLFNLPDPSRKKAFLLFSICTNLTILGFFKYFNFFADSFQQTMALIGWQVDPFTLNIILPVGISFYTFQTMSYTIDVYRNQITPTRQFIAFAAFLAFFPQLVAGPIERAKHLLPQFYQLRTFNSTDLKTGAWLAIWGLYKKIVIADNLAPIVNKIFADPSTASSGDLMIGILAFTFQIYCDFSGYSDTARGTARMLGFDIMINFNLPYLSKTPTEFWRRWHISLSSWLKDYLYISLGGNRLGTLKTYRNLMLTMLLGGLWHGAAWNFVLWGAYQGTILIIYRFLRVDDWLAQRQSPKLICWLQDLGLILIFFLITCFGWLLFRSPSLEIIQTFILGLNGFTYSHHLPVLAFYLWPLLAFQALQIHYNHPEPLPQLPRFLRLNLHLFILFSLLFLSSKGGQQFIYFNF